MNTQRNNNLTPNTGDPQDLDLARLGRLLEQKRQVNAARTLAKLTARHLREVRALVRST